MKRKQYLLGTSITKLINKFEDCVPSKGLLTSQITSNRFRLHLQELHFYDI